MKIALAQINCHIGNFEHNTNKALEAIRSAKAQKADLLIFPELSVCGYPSRDFLEFREFIEHCEKAVATIAKASAGIACIIGAPSVNPRPEGKNLFNSAFFLADGEVKAKVHKTLLPTYDVFDEYRYFEPNTLFEVINYKGSRIALTICEDLWNIDEDPLYVTSPMEMLIGQKPDIMINIAASPFSYTHAKTRKQLLKENCEKYKLPLFYVNHVGAQTELIFDGGSLVLNMDGTLYDEMNYFKEDLRVYTIEGALISSEHVPSWRDECPVVESIYQALILGIRDYFHKSGFDKAILGMSGGIDSAVVLALAAEALGPEQVMAVMMPSKFSSDHSISDSEEMIKRIGCKKSLIPINDLADAFDKSLEPLFRDLPFDLTEENIQARIRGVLLMGLSNKFGYILLNTSNKSELAVGYGTLYGDMCGGISVLGDVYKTQVYELARYINRDKEIIPEAIITKAPSAELRHGQKDQDSLPEYDLLDTVLHQYIEQRKSSKEIIARGFDISLVRKILRMVNSSEYKRHQTPPILRVSPKAFGVGRRMPIVGKYLG